MDHKPVQLFRELLARIRWIGAARTAASAVALSLSSRILILLINVLTGVLVARTLGPAGRGAATAIYLWSLMAAGLMTLGIPAAVRYQIRRSADNQDELFTSALVASAVLGLVACGIGYSIVPHFLSAYPPSVSRFAQSMMIFTPLMLSNATLQAFYESKGEFKWSNAMIYIPPALTLLCLITLSLMHRITPFTVPFAYECPFAIVTLTTLIRLRRFIRLPNHLFHIIRSQLSYGLRAYGMDILNTLSAQIDQALVVGLLTPTSFGFYAVAVSGARILSVLSLSLNTVLFPTASALGDASAIDLVSRSARIVVALTSVAALVLILAIPFLVSFAYGSEYRSIINLTQLLVIAVVLNSATSTFAQAFMATGRPEIATMLQCAGVCATIPLMLTFIPRFGLAGAAYAVDLSAGLRFSLCMACYPLFLRHNVPRLLPTRRDVTDLFRRLKNASVS